MDGLSLGNPLTGDSLLREALGDAARKGHTACRSADDRERRIAYELLLRVFTDAQAISKKALSPAGSRFPQRWLQHCAGAFRRGTWRDGD